MEQNNLKNWKTKTLVIGTALGALSGLAAAYLLARSAEKGKGRPPEVSTTDAFKVLLGVIGVVRGIAALGDE
jgi:hypothetical protein